MINKRIIVDNASSEHMFLTEYIMQVFPEARYETLYGAIIRNDIRLNYNHLEDDVFIANGDIIDFDLHFFQLGVVPVLDILYEDENFIAIEKMPGIPSFDEEKNGEINVYDMVLEYMLQKGECNIEALIVPYLCYAIPKEAGGIILIAKNEHAFEFIDEGLRQMKVFLHYEAIVNGKFKKRTDEIQHYMNNHFKIFSKPSPTASSIITRYRVIKELGTFSLIEVSPVTMRKFQVYAHLAHIGYPVLGDDHFGNRKLNNKLFLDYDNIWLRKITFSVGKNSQYFYMDGCSIQMDEVYYPTFITQQKTKGTI